MRRLRAKLRRGLTVIECLIAVTILAGTVLATSYTVVAAHQQNQSADRAMHAARLARDMLEEIISKACSDPDGGGVFGPEAGETTRAQYDDVDDYDGLSEPAGALKDAEGAACTGDDQDFSRSVTVVAGQQAMGPLDVSIPGRIVTVTLRHRSGERWQCMRFIPEPAAP